MKKCESLSKGLIDMFYSEVWEKSQGAKVWIKGKEYIDFTSGGIFCANLGNNNIHVWQSIFSQGTFLSSYRYDTKIRQEYTEKLLDVTGYEDVAFFSDGSMAVEAALRVMDRHWSCGTLKMPGSFHGKTRGPKTLASFVKKRELYFFGTIGFDYLIEGYRGYDAHFWSTQLISDLRKAQKAGSIICFDEIQSGFGRTGKMFAYEHYGIVPDLLIIGKAAGNGFPLSALLSHNEDLLKGADLSCTHGGNPMAMAAGLAVLEEFEKEDILRNLGRGSRAYVFQDELDKMWPTKVNGRGMVAALICKDELEADEIYTRAFKKGLLLVHTGKNTVKIGPPLTISLTKLLEGLEILKGVLHDI